MKAIFLDMYGVILKQNGGEFAPYVQQFFPQLTLSQIQEPWFKADRGELSSLEVLKILGFTGNLEKIEQDYLDTIELSDGFYEFAEQMHKYYKMAIISDDSSRWSQYLRKKLAINPFFDAISISGDLGFTKPDARIFLHTVEALGLAPQDCVFIDDRVDNLLAAQALGIEVILFNTQKMEYSGASVENFAELTDLLMHY